MTGGEVVAVPALRTRIGRYRLLGPIGHGGMADVYLALADAPGGVQNLAVVKVLRASHRHDDDLVTMFMDEARVAARLNHPNVVHTHEVDIDAGLPYIAMEFLEGQPMHRLQRKVPDGLSREATIRILAELLHGLHYVHEVSDYDGTPLQIVHRDVSPQNVFVTYDGHVKLMDFGIAKSTDSVAETAVGVLKGKLAYMAPEQVNREVVDRRADVFSVGVLLWEGLAGHRMWRDVSELEIAKRLDAGDVPELPDDPAVSDAMRSVCRRALEVDPERRWPSAQAFRHALLDVPEADARMPADALGSLLREAFGGERQQVTQLIEEGARALGISTAKVPASGIAPHDPSDETRRVTRPPEEPRRDVVSKLRPLSAEASGPSSVVGADEPTRVDGNSTGTQPLTQQSLDELPPPPPPARHWGLPSAIGLVVGGATVAAVLGVRQPDAAEPSASIERTPVASKSDKCAGRAEDAPLVELSGDIEGHATLRCDNRYLLRFNAVVRPGATLMIEPGTVIVGDHETRATLVVQPGARILAEGTPELPIVFTSERDAADRRPGDWGGLIILGRAPTNLTDRGGRPIEGRVEGLTDGGAYGGTDPEDDSGVIEYVRIEYGGIAIAPNNEINGLTLAGVGRGTRVSHVQVRNTADDCFEFFGGTVDADHLICDAPGDDGIDWDFGYTGRLRHVVVRSPRGGHGIEGDNDPNGSSRSPTSAPTLTNITLCGASSDARERYGMLVRRASRASVVGLLTSGCDAAIDVRDERTEIEVRASRFGPARIHPVAIAEHRTIKTGAEADDDGGFDEQRALMVEALGNEAGGWLEGCAEDPSHLAPTQAITVAVPEGSLASPWAGAFEDAGHRWDEPWATW